MDWALLLYLAVAGVSGALFGSFAAEASRRLSRGIPLVRGSFACPACGDALAWRDFVPLLRMLSRHGRCRRSGIPVGLAETGLALVFVLIWYSLHGVVAALVSATAVGLAIIVFTDMERGIIPDVVQAWLVPVGLALGYATGSDPIDVLGGLCFGVGLGLLMRSSFYLLRGRHGLGLGDVKFLGLAGTYLGFSAFPVFLTLASVLGIVMARFWRPHEPSGTIPFGPALSLSLLLALLWSNQRTVVF